MRYDPGEGGHGEGLLEKRPAGLLDPGHLIARHEQDLHRWLKFPQPYSEFATTHDRHHDIDEQEIRNAPPVVQHSNGFQRIGGAEYGIAVRSEDILGERPNLWLVIHDQDRALCRRLGGLRRAERMPLRPRLLSTGQSPGKPRSARPVRSRRPTTALRT